MPPRTSGVARPPNHPVQFPAQARFDPAAGKPPDLPAPTDSRSGCPRFMRMPADWWDSPPAVASPLRYAPQSASAARRLTGDTLRHWGLTALAEDAMLIVAELVANAVSHTVPSAASSEPGGEYLGLRLLRRPGEVICAVLDPSDAAPALGRPGALEEGGRGLQLVDALSDVWGWSPVAAAARRSGRSCSAQNQIAQAHRR
jgi:anti-sigma regulatory factor (Ser/Thr protein kinase)